MVRIILSGCNGKMGKVISGLANNFSNLSIVAGIDKNTDGSSYPVFSSIGECTVDADVILDFSRPDALDSLLKYAKEKNVGVVLCTTGFTDEQLSQITEASKEIPVFRSANMSIGINVVNKVLRSISALLYNNFDIEIIEKHHNQKVDAPSGTALLLANTIKDSIPEETQFTYGREGIAKREHKEIGIHAIRGGSIVGDHDVIFAGQGEVIEISHKAISREVFAVGALKACEFMYGKGKGFYSMDDVVK
ncbi:4-hydroxy-tetrahydrodipicolinate reductase [Clostridium sp. CX1]|uniref:4-hydroxy-tetrahydrodipicolinate reductase n=1 Tax=Clostridium tanneri TaxID=3037988 RepID=A0ABU4JSZ5_9CLOT|nr:MULTISPECIES: 4-hydroxy-tetrahydrodipicolinate reductase [unclassified Clostridium]MCT8977308.1 4-hydroxy-tetrahydrodipicolinate reductase [Clostridium sp. CX1]MDW8801275.1 4-hydroxy-tetrahydrodipicolinate reductase [Clostridium sp. A1-XYC3]